MDRTHLCLQKYHISFSFPGIYKSRLNLLSLFHHMGTVIFASDYFQFDSGQVLGPPPLHQHHVVFLQVVPFPGNKHHCFLPIRETHTSALSVGRVGLLWLPNHRLEHHGLQLGAPEGGTNRFGRWFGLPLTVHLVESCHCSVESGAQPFRGMPGHCQQSQYVKHKCMP